MMNSDLKSLIDTVKTMDEQIKLCMEITKNEIESAGYSFDIAEDLYRFTKEQIESFDSGIIMNIYQKYDNTMRTPSDKPKEYNEFIEEERKKILSFYESSCQLQDLIRDRNTLVDDVQKLMGEYSNYINSDEMKEKELEQIESLKKQIEDETDYSKKKKLEEKLHIIESTDTLDFIFERMTRLKEKEIENIIQSFFDPKKSGYILERFKDKMKQLQMNGDQYKSLLNIEEIFLEDDYRPLNNIFLFNLVRFIAYSDIHSVKESAYAQTLLIRTLKLVYHKYQNHDEEIVMIDKIRQLDDYFMPYVDYFKEKNTTSPDSEFRINLKKQREIETMKNIEKAFEDFGEPVPEGTVEELTQIIRNKIELKKLQDWFTMYGISYDENASLEELNKMRDDMNNPEEPEIEETNVSDAAIAITSETYEKVKADSGTTIIWPDEEE